MTSRQPEKSIVDMAPSLFLPHLISFEQHCENGCRSVQGTYSTSQKPFGERLNEQLQALGVHGYERLIAQLLCAAGYEDVRILRLYQQRRISHKGRNGHGGVDITANVRAEFGVMPILVQVKQYKRPVSRRFVDELRGALLRTEARQGLLVTTSTFAPAARQAALEDHIGPIYLIDGIQLQELLVYHRLGVHRDRKGRLTLRPRFFRRLEKQPQQPIPKSNTSR